MVSPSRKLTVSFGAFACTLEGFDDPFPIMRQVVDYFQALSAADPSFGAHPERPDTDYLKTLAEDSAGGAVEAELSEGGMILRQTEAEPSETALEPEDFQSTRLIQEPAPEISPEPEPVFAHHAPAPQADTILAQALNDERFEDTEDDLNTEFLAPQAAEPQAASQIVPRHDLPPQDMQGADLPDWAQDLIADSTEHGFEPQSEDQEDAFRPASIAQEEEAIERVLKATEERTQSVPELDRASPLAQLMKESEELVEAPSQSVTPEPEALSQGDVDDIFRAFAGENPAQPTAPATAADILRAEAEPVEQDAPEPKTVLSAAASTKATNGAMRLNFEGSLPRPAAMPEPQQPVQAQAPLVQEQPAAPEVAPAPAPEEKATLAPLLLTDAQKVPSEPAAHPQQAQPISLFSETPQPAQVELTGDALNSFTASVGADSLPELLEASAAFVTLVRGQATFSRRDIMTMLDTIESDREYTQEARIKSFGKLLRGGTLLRTGDGQFAISDRALTAYEGIAGVA